MTTVADAAPSRLPRTKASLEARCPAAIGAAKWIAVGRWDREQRGAKLHNYAVSAALAAKRREIEGRKRLTMPTSTHAALFREADGLMEDWRQAGSPGFRQAIRLAHRYLNQIGHPA